MNNKFYYLYIFTFLLLIPLNNLVKAENDQICSNNLLEASFELKDSWIYICDGNQKKSFIKLNKNQDQELINVPAFGTFPTYAALEGDISDPNSKIYNISPFDFKIIQASIIKKIDPVIQTTHQETGTKVMILSSEKEQEATNICQEKQPVQVFETKVDNIYICIEANQNDLNSINLSYIQKSKNNSYPLINLPVNLTSTLSYETADNQEKKYTISYQGLEIYENETKISTEAVINVYITQPNMTREDTH